MRPIIIGVGGGSGSGKTTVVDQMVRRLGHDRVSTIQHDSYYRDRSSARPSERDAINYDHPDALETSLLVEHLKALRDGHPVRVPIYDFTTHQRTVETVTVRPRRIVILEGILVLAHAELRELMDIRVFVDTEADLRFIRRLTRDTTERNRSAESVVEQYLRSVRPMHLQFVEPSKRHAHIIVPEGEFNRVAEDALMAKVTEMLERKQEEKEG